MTAVSSPRLRRDESPVCAGPACSVVVTSNTYGGHLGRPPKYCSTECRQAAYRARRRERDAPVRAAAELRQVARQLEYQAAGLGSPASVVNHIDTAVWALRAAAERLDQTRLPGL